MPGTSIKHLFILLGALLLTACTAPYVVQVSAIAEPGVSTTDTRYVLRNGNPEGKEDDLFFKEFSAYFIPLLAEKGYRRVNSRDKAEVEIFLRYAVSEGRSGISTFTHPVYETIGGNTINIVETKTDSGGTTTTTRSTVHIPLQTLYVGTAVESRSYTLYTSSVALEAYALKPKGKMLWKTLMNLTSESNDLRTTIPIMAAAAAPYIAGNSGVAKTIKLKRDDPAIAALREKASLAATK
ncbi:MAG TPA: hypothetical protein ENI97_08700 [Gammaproteobacteria bacterium]|nr:hypothetical protein [Gammaproteobacteria bacterium]